MLNGTSLECVSVIYNVLYVKALHFNEVFIFTQNWLPNIYGFNIFLRLSSTFVIKLKFHGETRVSKETGTKDIAATGNKFRTCDSTHNYCCLGTNNAVVEGDRVLSSCA